MDDVREVQDRFDQAERTADLDTLRELIAEDFLSIGPRGFVLDKPQWIDRHQEFTYHELETSEMDVRADGGEAFTRRLLTMAGLALLLATAAAMLAAPLLTRLYLGSENTGTADPQLATVLAYLLLPQIFF